MNAANDERLAKLEALFAEQEHVLQSLDRVVALQDRELLRLALELELLREQLSTLRAAAGSDIDPIVDKPPHY